jgi:AraC-like DNA-binding protein
MAVETVIRTEDLPVAERFEFWLEMISQTVVPVEVRSDHTADFRATIRVVDLGAVQVSLLDYPSMDARRTPKLIRRSDPGVYHLVLNLRGHAEITQDRRTANLAPRDLTLYDSSRPFRSLTHGGAYQGRALMALIPHHLLPLPDGKVSQLAAVGMSGGIGISRLVSRYLLELVKNAGSYSNADAARLTTVTLDLLAAMFAHELDAESLLPPQTHQRALLARIHAFIIGHLGDPQLSPQTIAAAHHISARTLHRLFSTHDSTVHEWIRNHRLEHCRRDLADPLLFARPIHAIAAHWGFTDNAHFSRTFKATYGMSPRDYRQRPMYDA